MKRPFLEVADLPKDTHGSLRGLRPTLVRVFNKARQHPAKISLLKKTMKFMYNACVAYEKQLTQSIEAREKAAEIAAAEAEKAAQAEKEAEKAEKEALANEATDSTDSTETN